MKREYYVFLVMAVILAVLLLLWIFYPTDKNTTAFIAAYLACIGGALAFSLLYLFLYFSYQAKLRDIEAYREKAAEAAREATSAELERLEAELREARRSIEELKEINERFVH